MPAPDRPATIDTSDAGTAAAVAGTAATPTPDEQHLRIAVAAYYLAEARGFEPGHELDDWLAAERAIATATSSA